MNMDSVEQLLVWGLGNPIHVRVATLPTRSYHQGIDYWQEKVERV